TAKVAQIGFLGLGPASAWAAPLEALRAGLRDLGYVEGNNIVFKWAWAERVDQLSELAAELVHENVDLIFAYSSTEVLALFSRRPSQRLVRSWSPAAENLHRTGHATSFYLCRNPWQPRAFNNSVRNWHKSKFTISPLRHQPLRPEWPEPR